MQTLKTRPAGFGEHDVFLDGEKVARFWFNRDRLDRGGRIAIHTAGRLTDLRTGATLDLGGYAWFADVKRDLPTLLAGLANEAQVEALTDDDLDALASGNF